MTFRTRMLVTFLLAVLLPMIALTLFVRNEMTDRLTAQYERRVESLIAVIEEDAAHQSEAIANSLAALRTVVVDDNRFRRAAVDRAQQERRYLLDYADGVMKLTGLSMLQIQDETGRIISSGHFRNEFDRMEPELPRLLATTPDGVALVQARAPDAPFLALARVDSIQMGNRQFYVVAGSRVGGHLLTRLAREAELTVTLVYPGGVLSSDAGQTDPSVDGSLLEDEAARESEATDAIVRELNIPFIDSERGELVNARFRVTHQLTELHALRRSIDQWFLLAVAASGVLAIILVSWLASRISRPLVELANKTSRIDLDRLDIDFETRRKDEIGVLSRMLGTMTERLRASTVLIKDAERRATFGDLARQVNHDIKNGLTPIRNVFRHLIGLAGNDPGRLPKVFNERQTTLESSISYLENLSSNYARLYPKSERRTCDVNDIVRRVVRDFQGSDRVDFGMSLDENIIVLGDPVSLRRIIENLVNNAIDSLETRPGNVTISTALVPGEGDRPNVRITVADSGAGMNEEVRAKIFDDFYTTKDDGTGLGLSIVRRLVMDLGGSIDVESEQGKGSRFLIDLPGGGVT